MPGPYQATAIANLFLRMAMAQRLPLVSRKLQKLIYFAHGYYMAARGLDADQQVRPLISEPFEVWRYGPVCPSIYHEFAYFGGAPIIRLAVKYCPESQTEVVVPPPDADTVLDSVQDYVWRTYGDMPEPQLSAVTRKPNGAWDIASQNVSTAGTKVIPNELVFRDFRRLVHTTQKKAAPQPGLVR